jgi:hypothetical protein
MNECMVYNTLTLENHRHEVTPLGNENIEELLTKDYPTHIR